MDVRDCLYLCHLLPTHGCFSVADQWDRDGEHVPDGRKDADREVEGQAEDGGAERRAGHAAERARPLGQHPLRQRLGAGR